MGGEPLYRPHDSWICDRNHADKNRLMALMKLGKKLEDLSIDHKEKCEWTLKKVCGKETWYILNHKGEPLYRPHDYWICDRNSLYMNRLMALMKIGKKLEDLSAQDKERCEWHLKQMVENKRQKHECGIEMRPHM